MGYHFASAQLCKKVLWAIKGFHLDVDEASLSFDRVDRLLGRQSAGNRLLEEEADEFPLIGQDLLADDGGLTSFEERLSAIDALVVSQKDGGEVQLAAATSHLEGRNPAIEGSGAVQVQVHPNP